MGRPATKPTKLKDGYYIEVRNKGSKSGIKIRRDSKEAMLTAIKDYEREEMKKVVFPTGAYVKNRILNVYYGASDKYVCLASCNLNKLLNSLSG